MGKSEREPAGPDRLFGIETEYGLLVEDRGAQDLMEESRLLVRAYEGAWAGPWDYRVEDPRADMRGFRVDRLSFDRDDARLDREGPASHMSTAEQRSDRVLANGARLYNDHGHPEYATPECRTLRDLVAHDRAGERILLRCADARTEAAGRKVRLFKNNTDFHGMSYGCHESYLCARSVPFERLLEALLPFFITRILYAGAGKTGVETSGPLHDTCQFQLSQRADFFTEIASVDTLAKRPLFNTRDEPHADPRVHRRLHVICGDANLNEFATALKVGTTCLALDLVEAGWEPLFRLKDPVGAIKRVSRDPSLRWILELEDGRTLRATDIQRIYQRDAARLMSGASPDVDWTLREWERVLDDLERDPFAAEDRLDWVAKRKLLETFIEAEGTWWEDPVLRSLDLEYHNLSPDEGLFQGLEQAGQAARVVEDADIERAMTAPPEDTRAALRGELVRRFGPAVTRVSWERVLLRGARGEQSVPLPAVRPSAALLSGLRAARTVAEALAALNGGAHGQGVQDDTE